VVSRAAPNNGMHPTADTQYFIKLNCLGRRLTPGFRCLEMYGRTCRV
jgi:hypothetical protein